MSHSWRKIPYVTDGQQHHGKGYNGRGRRKQYKRFSNRAVRHDWSIPDGNYYRKNGFSYDICDFKFWGGETQRGSSSGYGIQSHWWYTLEDRRKDFLKAKRK